MVQGIMAALSAGLLIYAATVEMLAADFVLAAGPEGLAQAHPGKQALALVSLAAGVAGMSVIGYGTSVLILTAPLMLLPSGYGLRKYTSYYCEINVYINDIQTMRYMES
jgi:hypothetical protein